MEFKFLFLQVPKRDRENRPVKLMESDMNIQFWRRQDTLRALHGLDETRLRDLGLLQSDIHEARRWNRWRVGAFLEARRASRSLAC